MKTIPPPVVKGTTEGVLGFDEFKMWAHRNLPLWNSAQNYCAVAGLTPNDHLKLVAYHLVLQNQELKDRLMKQVAERGFIPK